MHVSQLERFVLCYWIKLKLLLWALCPERFPGRFGQEKFALDLEAEGKWQDMPEVRIGQQGPATPAHDLLPHQSGRSSPWLAASAAPAELPLRLLPETWVLSISSSAGLLRLKVLFSERKCRFQNPVDSSQSPVSSICLQIFFPTAIPAHLMDSHQLIPLINPFFQITLSADSLRAQSHRQRSLSLFFLGAVFPIN